RLLAVAWGMRLLLLFLAALSAVAAAELTGHDIVRHVLKTWNPRRPMKELGRDDHSSIHRVEEHVKPLRSKRSVGSDFISASKTCNMPGYTGEFCEFPICIETNQNVPDVPQADGFGASIDGAVLTNCSQQYVVLVDETMYWITFFLEAGEPINPTFDLQGEDGTIYPNDEVIEQSRSSYGVRFDSLPPGQYLVKPSADLPTTYCQLSMRARTEMTLQGGFVLGDGYAVERSDYPNTRYTYFQQSAPVTVHVNRNRSPGTLNAISFIGEENSFSRPKLLNKRYNCAYEYIFESFYCDKTGYYYAQVEGISFQGFNFRRILPFNCIVDPRPTPVPTTSPAPTVPSQCQNGGVLIENLDSTSYCYCVGLFTGENCATRLCANGGTTTASNTCQCADGYDGQHCENVVCQDTQTQDFNPNQPTLTFVIRTRSQLSVAISEVTGAISDVVNQLAFDPDYIKAYVLVLFNNNTMLLSNSYGTFGDMEVDLLKAEHTGDDSGDCTDAVFSNVAAALQRYLTYNSQVYVITDGLPNDIDKMETVFHVDSYLRVPLNFIFLEPSPTSGCTTSIESSSYRAMDSLAKRTGGMTFYFGHDSGLIYDFLYQHMYNIIYRSQLLLSNDLPLCSSQNVYNQVAIDISVEQLVIVATGRNLSLVLSTPDGDLAPYDSVFNDGTNYIWTTNGPQVGNWLVSMWTSDQTLGCNFKVFQKSYHNQASLSDQYDLFWAVAPRIDSDQALLQPQYGMGRSIVMHLTNYRLDTVPERVQTFLSIRAIRDNKPITVYNSNGIWRDGCSYQFYFPSMTCQTPNEILYFNFFVLDSLGFSVQRAGVMYCVYEQPTPQPPPHQCQNGGIINSANTSCFCPPGYTGTYCQQIMCYNGGSPAGEKCQCPIGWTGTFCELFKCTSKGASPEYLRTNVDMVFVLELTQQAHAQVFYLNSVFADLIRSVQSQNSQWITRYIVVGFNSSWADVLYQSPSNDPAEMIAFLDQLSQQVPTDTGCQVQLWKAIDLVSGIVRRGSYLEIFTASPQAVTTDDTAYTVYERERSLGLRVNAFVNALEKGYACGATDADFSSLFGLTSTTTGYNYPVHPMDLPNAVRLIPLQFSSGIVFSQYQPDCTGTMQMFFPIDAYAQTIQLNIVGFNKTISVYDGAGNWQPSMSVLSDPITGWDILEIRKQCDQGWDEVEQNCLRFVLSQSSYSDARQFCHDAGGSLVDDLSEVKHQFLQSESAGFDFWLGLTNFNNSGYVWDGPDGTPPLPLSNPTYWVNNQQPVYDASKECVFWDSTQQLSGNTWTPDACSIKRSFICQKHRYDPDHRPNVIGELDLPAGKWYVTVKVDSNTQRSCFVQARVQSDLQIVPGFVTTATGDQPDNDPVQDSPNNRLITYIHSLDNANRSPILTHALLNDAANGTFYNAMTYSQRAQCSYPWLTQSFSCPNSDPHDNEFTITHMGEDEYGNLFQRVTFGHCSTATINCNGGVRWQGLCICTEYWTGKQCNIPICVNGGVLSQDYRRCECPDGYAGEHCEFELCMARTPITFSPNGKTFVLIVETTFRNQPMIDALVANLTSIVYGAFQNGPWFSNYALVTYDSSGVTSQYFQYTNIGSLVMGLNSAAGKMTDPGSCSMPLYGALRTALSSVYVLSPNSEVFAVTSAGVSDQQVREGDVELVSNVQAHFTYIYNSASDCGTIPYDDSITQTTRLAYSSSGNVLFVTASDFSQMFSVYLPTLYGSYVLTNPTGHQGFKCSTPSDWYVEVDFATTAIYVTTSAAYGFLGVINPMRNEVVPTLLFKTSDTQIYEIDVDRMPGVYTLVLTSPGDCFVHVFAVSGAKVYYEFAETTEVDPAASHIDGYNGSPEVGVSNVVTLHVDAAVGTVLKQIELFDPDSLLVVLRSPLYRRMNCSFEYYSDPFTCTSEAIAMFVYGEDDRRQPFRRQELTYCRANITSVTTATPPTVTSPLFTSSTSTQPPKQTTPSPATTISTTTTPAPVPITFDVVVLIDVSQSASTRYDDMSQFVTTLLSAYAVSQTYTRVAIIPVFGNAAFGPMVIASLNAVDSMSVLQSYLAQAKQYNDFDDQGQALAQSLYTAINPNFKNAGYRTDISNHVILYITATSGFTDQPQMVAQQILQSGDYGIVTVGYGPLVTDLPGMQAIAGGQACSFYGSDLPSLLNQVDPIRALISSADSNNGKYCGN
uniref:EGF-like domain-containing protein n=1 Tax=Haemonchus contortus TaxID=6289 RepID=A0A7I4YB27_HAECO